MLHDPVCSVAVPPTGQWVSVTHKRPAKPRYISRDRAMHLQKELDTTGLCSTLLSVESRNLQTDGWVFSSALKNDAEGKLLPVDMIPANTDTREYTYLAIDNKWNDIALFYRLVGV